MESNLEEIQERFAAKRRVVLFLVIWQYILGLHFFLDPVVNSFVEVLIKNKNTFYKLLKKNE